MKNLSKKGKNYVKSNLNFIESDCKILLNGSKNNPLLDILEMTSEVALAMSWRHF